MNVLLIGSGGREHSLALSISKSPNLQKLICIPGNPGISETCESIQVSISDFDSINEIVVSNSIDLIIVGPEQPLAEGIQDYFTEKGILVFGPSQKAAQIESSKAFAKDLMKKYGIPTAAYEICNSFSESLVTLKKFNEQVVVKVSGLAGGKGAIVCQSHTEARQALKDIFTEKSYGEAGSSVVLEEFMEGEEVSLFAFCDGKDYVLLSSAQDHKRIYEGDKGANTGGMGAYSPAPIATKELIEEAKNKIISPTLEALNKEGIPYIGVLYAGLMVTNEGAKVVEFNCRLGDPETQVVLPLVKSDTLELMFQCAKGDVSNYKLELSDKFASTVVLASKGYPFSYSKGKEIKLHPNFENSDSQILFHAGTKLENGKLLTNGGRVLACTGIGNSVKESLDLAYDLVEKVEFAGKTFRKDIGWRALAKS
ncbi:MAG: phosphoribosylamine--glycine ligase [Calditrichaeota bacterium]|nr:MAG: phosphoribosylamine--glycine ligase [Calditrichota bacterium]